MWAGQVNFSLYFPAPLGNFHGWNMSTGATAFLSQLPRAVKMGSRPPLFFWALLMISWKVLREVGAGGWFWEKERQAGRALWYVCLSAQEELTSTSVEHIIVNPNAAYDKFKDKRVGTKGLGKCVCFQGPSLRMCWVRPDEKAFAGKEGEMVIKNSMQQEPKDHPSKTFAGMSISFWTI